MKSNSAIASSSIPPAGILLGCISPPSFMPQTDMGDALYEWADTLASNMSSVRLAAMLRHRHCNQLQEGCLLHAAKQELIRRGDYEKSLGWQFVSNTLC